MKAISKIVVGIRFGAMSPKISKQLNEQGFIFDKDKVLHFEKDAEALNRLRIRGYLTDTATNQATQKLFNSIKKHIESANPIHK